MGWKIFKEKYGIEHIVHIVENQVCIGSSFSSNLVSIDIATGQIHPSEVFPNFLNKYYPEVISSSPTTISELLTKPDEFKTYIPVYTFKDDLIIEKYCETLSYPNVTHDGVLMYENRFSVDKNIVIAWAKRNAELLHARFIEKIEDAEANLIDLKNKAHIFESFKLSLEKNFPEVN